MNAQQHLETLKELALTPIEHGLFLTDNEKSALLYAIRAIKELERVASVLPGPIWNDRKVLVWSMLDIERVRATLGAPDDYTKG